MLTKTDIRVSLTEALTSQLNEVLFAGAYSSLVYYLYEHHDLDFLASFQFLPVSIFITVFSVFLAFRNNSAYGRWWEARQLWGELVNQSRIWSLQLISLLSTADIDDNAWHGYQKEALYRHLAFINAMRLQLRHQLSSVDKIPYLDPEDHVSITHAPNMAVQILVVQGKRLQEFTSWHRVETFKVVSLVQALSQFHNILGACERIKNTPFPREYDSFVKLLQWLMIFLLPVYLLGLFNDELSRALIVPSTVVIVSLLGYANKAGEILEDPFENRESDVPMTALCNTIERDLLYQLNQGQVPAKMQTSADVLM